MKAVFLVSYVKHPFLSDKALKKGIINKDRRKRSLLTYTTSLLKSQYIEKSTGKSTSDYI